MARARTLLTFIVAISVTMLSTACLGEGSARKDGDKKVEIFGAFSGPEADAFRASLVDFQRDTGITVSYVPSSNFTELIRSRVAGNNAPDIAIFPQPGLLVDLANSRKLKALDTVLDLGSLRETLIPGLLDATVGKDGKVYGAPIRMAVKSLVWYPHPEFERAGYTAPKTEGELLALTDRIKADGRTPWCLGMESGQATGWVATDWLEEYVLRFGGPETYDKWTSHEIKFNDPVVKRAAEEFAKIAFTQGNVLGGRQSISSNAFGTSANPMFAPQPECWLHRQGNFITSEGFFPPEVTGAMADNVGLFVLPRVEEGYSGQPILGGGDLASIFNPKDKDVVQVLEYITSDRFGAAWAKDGGWLSPHKTFDANQYPDQITRTIAEFAAAADVFRFDGSDLMPGAVGSGSFWKGMVAWISGQKTLDQVLDEIEKSWPKT